MYTTGLVLILTDNPALANSALGQIEAAGPFRVGESKCDRRPVVLEANDPKAAHDWHDWAASRPGVLGLEVVFVHWDDESAEVSHART